MALISIGVGLLLSEMALRILGYSYPIFYQTDEIRGLALRPNVKGWYRKEGESYVVINSDGLRDREHSIEKPPGTFRIAIIGDSYAEALQVPVEAAFWNLMAQRLNTCQKFSGQNVEAINFGVSGYGTAQEALTLENFVWKYQPDMVLLAVTTNNDITDNLREFKRVDEIPYFILSEKGLELDNSFRATKAFQLRSSKLNRIAQWFRDHLRIIQAIHEAQVGVKGWLTSIRAKSSTPSATQDNGSAQSPAQTTRLEDIGIDNLIYREPDSATWKQAWAVTEALMLRIRDDVSEKRARLLVATLSNGVQVYPNSDLRSEFEKRIGVNTLFYPDFRTKSFGDKNGIDVINLAPSLLKFSEENNVVLHGFGKDLGNGHWNQRGHQAAAELLADRICAEK